MKPLNSADISFPQSISVTAQEIDLSHLTQSQQNFYKDLFIELIRLYTSRKQSRIIIGFAGPTGSGKSLITALFQNFAAQITLPFKFQALGIDAFHYSNDFLETHKDTAGKTLKEVKGRFDTYNVSKLISTLKEYKSGKTISLPEYSRKTHNPIEDVTAILEENVLLVVEGLWLFYDENGWEEIAPLLDYKIFIEADKQSVKDKVIQRHEKGGRSREEAERYYETIDVVDSTLVMKTKNKADRIIPSYYEVR